jgi:hypothetical protein
MIPAVASSGRPVGRRHASRFRRTTVPEVVCTDRQIPLVVGDGQAEGDAPLETRDEDIRSVVVAA